MQLVLQKTLKYFVLLITEILTSYFSFIFFRIKTHHLNSEKFIVVLEYQKVTH